MLEEAMHQYHASGKTQEANILSKDLAMLQSMSSQAQAFGEALELDSVSTFECIVENDSHYFMEVNTVSRWSTGSRKWFMDSNFKILIIRKILLSVNPSWKPCCSLPVMVPASLNQADSKNEFIGGGTDQCNQCRLRPHGGGLLRFWSEPGPNELRDDQGIGLRNPDTGLLQPYHLAGAYDSNVALSITQGHSRQDSLEQLAEVLRTMEVRGVDLQLNTGFHYGLIHWILGQDAMLRPNTRFVQSYLALAGELSRISGRVNLEMVWNQLMKKRNKIWGKKHPSFFSVKKPATPPHRNFAPRPSSFDGLAGSRNPRRWDHQEGVFRMLRNPFEILSELYHYLRLEPRSNASR